MQRFIDFLKAGRLVTSKCISCRKTIWPPSDHCPSCLGDEVEWVELEQRGRLIEYSESFLMDEPSLFGLVELDDGIRLVAKIECADASRLRRGMPVAMVRCGVIKNEPYFEFQPI